MVALLIAAGAAWASYARLDEVASASGEIVPQGQVKLVQHLEGGILQRIDVRDGQSVSAGDPLITLDLGSAAMNPKELQVRLDGLALRRVRLRAEAAGIDPTFPEAIAKRRPDMVRAERETFGNRRQQIASAIAVLRAQARQREREIRELEARRRAVSANLKLARERLAMSLGLLERRLVSRMEHLRLAGEVKTLEGQIAELKPGIPRLRAALAEARERMREAALKFKRGAVEELGEVELALARNRELYDKVADQVRRTVVRSPIDGVVKNLRYHTIGGVIGAGEPIMEVVPRGDRLVIEARLRPTDIGYVAVGQPATVKVSTYYFVRYGGLDGQVSHVAADSSSDRSGAVYFKVIVRTDKVYLGERPGSLPIVPGMQVTVDIHTGERTVIDCLINPVLKLKHEAFRER